MQARSRLKSKPVSELNSKPKERRPVRHSSQNKSGYIKHLPLLLLSLPFYFAVYWILTNIYPDEIANAPIHNSYLGLLIPFFLANFFALSYSFLNLRRGAIFSLFLTILLFLKLQQFIFEMWWLLPLALIFSFASFLVGYKKEK